jgi:hypothetical protein
MAEGHETPGHADGPEIPKTLIPIPGGKQLSKLARPVGHRKARAERIDPALPEGVELLEATVGSAHQKIFYAGFPDRR